ncbi:MAG: tRNA lysidine(34) synthetase TilS [Sulfurovaceae bacterium]|nr:tRNA lysidine(34) synthetase TilS [Sulfurovaceae bacterium]MDD5548386.1 tRNA lysidine(34) synthetase TilS [Sulfurovaceae bacterium]
MTLSSNIYSLLTDKKILLAFSGGIDSTALFFLLNEHGIKCDLAIVDYGIREQSKDEVAYAKELASIYNIKCFTTTAPKFESHFEQNARNFRYEFFEDIINKEGYEILLTAHQLNDNLEWLLMRLCKGAGVSELVGLNEITKKKNYLLVRPLLDFTKDELLEYLKTNNHKYFIDQTNSDEGYERNYFRVNYSDKLIKKYENGIKKSFKYLNADILLLKSKYEIIFEQKELKVAKLEDLNYMTKTVDLILKELGYLMSSKQREEIQENKNVVIGGLWAIGLSNNILFIAPHRKVVLPKEFKEMCRINNIPPLVRGYIYDESIDTIGFKV